MYYRLTAFVVRSFVSAQQYIYIDDNVVNQAAHWMFGQQLPDGSFRDPGRLIHTEMKGGVANRNDALTAYVITAVCKVKQAVSLYICT